MDGTQQQRTRFANTSICSVSDLFGFIPRPILFITIYTPQTAVSLTRHSSCRHRSGVSYVFLNVLAARNLKTLMINHLDQARKEAQQMANGTDREGRSQTRSVSRRGERLQGRAWRHLKAENLSFPVVLSSSSEAFTLLRFDETEKYEP